MPCGAFGCTLPFGMELMVYVVCGTCERPGRKEYRRICGKPAPGEFERPVLPPDQEQEEEVRRAMAYGAGEFVPGICVYRHGPAGAGTQGAEKNAGAKAFVQR